MTTNKDDSAKPAKKAAAPKKPAAKKPVAKAAAKPAAKKTVAKKPVAKKATAAPKKAEAPKKAPAASASKAAPKKAAAKPKATPAKATKAPPKKVVAKKPAVKKAAAVVNKPTTKTQKTSLVGKDAGPLTASPVKAVTSEPVLLPDSVESLPKAKASKSSAKPVPPKQSGGLFGFIKNLFGGSQKKN